MTTIAGRATGAGSVPSEASSRSASRFRMTRAGRFSSSVISVKRQAYEAGAGMRGHDARELTDQQLGRAEARLDLAGQFARPVWGIDMHHRGVQPPATNF